MLEAQIKAKVDFIGCKVAMTNSNDIKDTLGLFTIDGEEEGSSDVVYVKVGEVELQLSGLELGLTGTF